MFLAYLSAGPYRLLPYAEYPRYRGQSQTLQFSLMGGYTSIMPCN